MNSIGAHREMRRANSRATMQSREFRRTYGIESVRIGQDGDEAEKENLDRKDCT
jgi:hypothetical protein